MGYEVEVKYRVEGHSDLAARLTALGATSDAECVQEDAYLSHPARDFARTNEALRLRRIGAENRITYKGPRRAGPTKTREEIELPLGPGPGSFAQWHALFKNLGFQPVAVIRKRRATYHLMHKGRPLEIALDVAEGIGAFAEVEALAATEDDLADAQAAVLDLAATLGLTAVEPRSYLRMALERRGGDGGGGGAGAGAGNPSGQT